MNAIIESMNAWGARWAGFALPMLVQSAVLIALLFALDLALRTRVRATIRYAVWMLSLVKLALPPSLASPTGAAYWLPPERARTYSTPALAPDAAAAEFNIHTTYKAATDVRGIAPLGTVSLGLTWQADCFVVWLVVASGLGLWVVWRLRVVLGVLRESAKAPETLRALLESCRQQLGLKHAMPLRCASIGSPAICGVFRPIILIPPSLADHLSASEMRSVLLHELAHHKRGDLWVNHAQILLQIVYWYHPLLWLANASIRRAREEAVDEMVLVEMGGEAPTYPATLLHVAKLGLGRPSAALGLMGILERGRGLTQRILHIMNRPLPHTARIGVRGWAAVLLLALVVVPMASHSEIEQSGEPSYGGKTLTAWLEESKNSVSIAASDTEVDKRIKRDSLEKTYTAVQHIGPRAIPTLLKWVANTTNGGGHLVATLCIEKLGPEAKAAVPGLIAILGNTQEMARYSAFNVLQRIGPAATEALPAILDHIQHDPSDSMRSFAVTTLANNGIGKTDPDKVVPILIECLAPANKVINRPDTLRALAGLGPKAGKAVPAIRPYLNDPDQTVRKAASDALEQIVQLR